MMKRQAEAVEEDELRLSPSQERALQLVREGRNVLVTGRAGTGKSELLGRLDAGPFKKMGLCAMSGVAASHVGGTTLHSYLGLPITPFDGPQLLERLREKRAYLSRRRWTGTALLIVDECSMLDARALSALDHAGRALRRRPDVPFGGMQVVLVGDFLQTTPIPGGTGAALDGRLLFEWSHFRDTFSVVHLTTNFRQRGDARLQAVLEDVRRGVYSEPTLVALRECSERALDEDGCLPGGKKRRPTQLFSTKLQVASLNQRVLNGVTEGRRSYPAADTARTDGLRAALERQCAAPRDLTLAEGVRVLLLKNLSVPDGLVNGATGTVLDTAGAQGPLVQFDCGQLRRLGAEPFTMEAGGDVLAKRVQIPLIVAYALSIHKAQGLTLDHACVSVQNLFAPNMLYVALSRVRSLDGLVLRDCTAANLKSCSVDPVALLFYEEGGGEPGGEPAGGEPGEPAGGEPGGGGPGEGDADGRKPK